MPSSDNEASLNRRIGSKKISGLHKFKVAKQSRRRMDLQNHRVTNGDTRSTYQQLIDNPRNPEDMYCSLKHFIPHFIDG